MNITVSSSHQTHCVNAFHLYDWVQKKYEGELDVFKSDGTDEIINGINLCELLLQSNRFFIEAMIVDENGCPASPERGITTTELTNSMMRTKKKVNDEDNCSSLYRAVMQKQGRYVLKLVDQTTGQICRSNPIPFTIQETVYLYAPTGTTVQSDVISVEFTVTPSCINREQELRVEVRICQNVTSGCSKTIQLEGAYIHPREELQSSHCKHSHY
ncbi:hypothetical protein JF536_17120 [Priestia flexa]|uniref:hypothetical protein n=1 Tax=Priestia flexa TaxID=86664 RepID=UPI001A8CDEDD|nr:hypothetical protein [Priestia flexa]MBN8435788.1 hypothetical protein [Priestia flexa]MCA0968345.1 hypothetical protein [Priestia flexa]